jgi:16S rRNA G966 N2-methylase RsmD
MLIWVLWLTLWLLFGTPKGTTFAEKAAEFSSAWGLWLCIWSVGATVLTWLLSLPPSESAEEQRLRRLQKERVRVLDGFEPTSGMKFFHDDRSIYTAIVDSLSRLKAAEPRIAQKNAECDVCMLLCSPAMDYQREAYKEDINIMREQWGKEFIDKVVAVSTIPTLYMDICHLPMGLESGTNAMRNFLSVLASYLSQTPEGFRAALEALEAKTAWVLSDWIPTLKERAGNRLTTRDHTINIPFQIVLVNCAEFKEVVVSFAGREILEKHRSGSPAPSRFEKLKQASSAPSPIKGFFSSDPYVVETFHCIYHDYVRTSGREQFIPIQTLEVMEKHRTFGAHRHILQNYYHGTLPTLRVLPGSFSPAIGNSTKFTTWAIDKILTTGYRGGTQHWCRKILDVGAGTGVLGLVAQRIVEAASATQPELLAVEASASGVANLRENCQGVQNVQIKQWQLKADQAGGYFEDVNRSRVALGSDFGPFDLIIGDLPFLDACDGGRNDMRFLDPKHSSHQNLFRAVQDERWLNRNGWLVTSFSSLGGPEDVAAFERFIRNNNLHVVQCFDFYEAGYMWMVYAIKRAKDFLAEGDRFWWNRLGVSDCVNDRGERLSP